MKFMLALVTMTSVLAAQAVCAKAKSIQDVPNTEASVPLTGIIREIDDANRRMSIRDDKGKTVSVPLDNSVLILRDGEQVQALQLHEGDRVVVNTRG